MAGMIVRLMDNTALAVTTSETVSLTLERIKK